jgi:hypothetical protein
MSSEVADEATTRTEEEIADASLLDKQDKVSNIKQFTGTSTGAEKRECL